MRILSIVWYLDHWSTILPIDLSIKGNHMNPKSKRKFIKLLAKMKIEIKLENKIWKKKGGINEILI